MVNRYICGALLAACFSLSACVPKSDLEAATAAASAASATAHAEAERAIAAARAEAESASAAAHAAADAASVQIAMLKDEVAQLETQNSDLRAQVGKVSQGLDAAQQQLARKPPMPVSVSLRKAFFGNSLVAVFSTTIKQDFPVLVTVHSPALNTTKQFRVQLNAQRPSELGVSDGAVIDYGDEMLIQNANFEPARVGFQRPAPR